MKRKAFWLILLLAVFLRFFQLGSIPVGLSWDEAAIGYNGYGIATVHRDEWLVKMPVTFKSFGDYKAALAIYADSISTWVFGLNAFGIRFPMAAASIVTVISAYFIGKKLFSSEREALLAMLFVAVSPLNVHYARIAFESGIGVSLTALGVLFFLYAAKKPWLYILSSPAFVLSMYAYHSTKIAVPLLILLLAIRERKRWTKHWRPAAVSLILGVVMLYPLLKETVRGNAGERFYMTSAIADRNGLKPIPQVVGTILKNYARHFTPSFLLFGETQNFRHGNEVFGILGYTEFALLLAGLLSMVHPQWRKTYGWLVLAVLIGILPAAISNEVPHSNRAHGIIPWVEILAVVGYGYVASVVERKKAQSLLVTVGVLTVLQTLWYSATYAKVYTTVAAKDFQYGYGEAVTYARLQEPSVHSVLFTSAYGQPYIYILLQKKLTPIQWQQGALANYEIRDFTWDDVKERNSTLVVGTPEEIPADAPGIEKEILFPDGSVAFRIVRLP